MWEAIDLRGGRLKGAVSQDLGDQRTCVNMFWLAASRLYMDLEVFVKGQDYDLRNTTSNYQSQKTFSEFYRITSHFTFTLYFGSEASMLSTFVTFSEKCCFLSVLFSLAYALPLETFCIFTLCQRGYRSEHAGRHFDGPAYALGR
jgi:hypothetical protein